MIQTKILQSKEDISWNMEKSDKGGSESNTDENE